MSSSLVLLGQTVLPVLTSQWVKRWGKQEGRDSMDLPGVGWGITRRELPLLVERGRRGVTIFGRETEG